MTAERRPLQPVKGLSPTDLPGPPERRRRLEGAGSSAAPATFAANGEQVSAPLTNMPPPKPETRAISLSLPIDLRQALKAHARAHNTTQADTVMDAVLHQYDRLSELVATSTSDVSRDALFVRTRTKKSDEPVASLSLRMHTRNVRTLDELVRTFGASSRSHLCAAALTAELTPRCGPDS